LALVDKFAVPSAQGMLIGLKLTHEDLASMSGVSRQYANVTLSDLRKRGYLIMDKRSIILTDCQRLAAILPG
jgi:CRP/FNR family transcriptional regulator